MMNQGRGPVGVLAADAVREILACKPQRPVLLAETGSSPRGGVLALEAKITD